MPALLALATAVMEAFDIILTGDMCRAGDLGLRIAQEIRANFALGLRTGLAHAGTSSRGARIHPEIQRCVRDSKADVIEPIWNVRARLMIVHSPESLPELPEFVGAMAVDKGLLIADGPLDWDASEIDQRFARTFGPVSWGPANPWVRTALAVGYPAIRIEKQDWCAISEPPELANSNADGRLQSILWLNRAPDEEPGSTEANAQGTHGALQVHHLDLRAAQASCDPQAGGSVNLGPGGLSAERLLGRIDAVAYFPADELFAHPDATIAAALAEAKLVFLALPLQSHYGNGPIYCEPGEIPTVLTRLRQYPGDRKRAEDDARRCAIERFSIARHRERVEALVGTASKTPGQRLPCQARIRAKRALVVVPDSGQESLSPLLAICLRSKGRFDPVFVTMSAAVGAIEALGFTAEYVPPPSCALATSADWDLWFQVEMEYLIDAYDAGLVVYGGRDASPGLIGAVAPRGDCKFALIATGNSGKPCDNDNSQCFDLVIELQELFDRKERTITPLPVDLARRIGPVTLFDESEILPRRDAAIALGLDHTRPAILLRLGADNAGVPEPLAGRLIEQISAFEDLQIGLLEDEDYLLNHSWSPRVKRIKGCAIGRYFNAFDISVARASYDAFHDAIGLGLPTVFVVGEDPSEQAQRDRATFAQSAGGALEFSETKLGDLPALIRLLLAPQANAFIRENCRRIRRTNGADEAAAALAELMT